MDRRLIEDAWQADEPPAGFAERTVARALAEKKRRSRVRRRLPAALAAVLAVAAAAMLWLGRGEDELGAGERTASERVEVTLGTRAVAVLEKDASIRWNSAGVEQARGDVFYRVEPGRPFVVKTPVGEVAVLGTCFRVRVVAREPEGNDVKRKEVAMAAGGAALGALVMVTVYEGRVQLSHANEKVALAPGDTGTLSADGARKVEGQALADAEAVASAAVRESAAEGANKNLVADIAELNRRIEKIGKDKEKLEEKLKSAQADLAKQNGTPVRTRSQFDLDDKDWAELAKDGTVKFRVPCMRSKAWKPDAKVLDELGLGADDAETIRGVYERSYDRMWKALRPLCTKAVGNEQVVDILGPDTCVHVIVDVARRQDGAAASEAMRLLSETRAGMHPAPVGGAPQHPVFETFWTMTGEMGRFEADLAQSYGPEEAKRLAYSDKMCAGHSTFGGPGPREPGK
jgi:ferric-dicitrate binding protein FerR (iron transport regulator)